MSVTAGNGAITLSHLPRYSYTMRAVPFRILNTGFFVGLARQRVLLWSRRYRRTSANVMLNPASGSGLPMARMRKYGRQQSTEFTPLQKSPRQGPAKQSNCTPKRLVIWAWAFFQRSRGAFPPSRLAATRLYSTPCAGKIESIISSSNYQK